MQKMESILSFFSRRAKEDGTSMPPLTEMPTLVEIPPMTEQSSSDCAVMEQSSSYLALMEQSSSDCALIEQSSSDLVLMDQSSSDLVLSHEEDTTLCSEGITVQLFTTKQRNAHQRFGIDIRGATGLDLIPAPSNNGRLMSQCGTCLKANKKTFRRNVKEKWVNHAKVCPGLLLLREKSLLAPAKLSAEAQAFIMHVTAGGEKHRRNTCDAYVATYWVYKYKLPFTTGDKLKEVCITLTVTLNLKIFDIFISSVLSSYQISIVWTKNLLVRCQ